MTKTKIALAAALFATASSVAMAQGFDSNMANRYQSYASPIASSQAAAPRATLHSAPVRLQNRNVRLNNPATVGNGWVSPVDVDRFDRASSPYAGGGF